MCAEIAANHEQSRIVSMFPASCSPLRGLLCWIVVQLPAASFHRAFTYKVIKKKKNQQDLSTHKDTSSVHASRAVPRHDVPPWPGSQHIRGCGGSRPEDFPLWPAVHPHAFSPNTRPSLHARSQPPRPLLLTAPSVSPTPFLRGSHQHSCEGAAKALPGFHKPLRSPKCSSILPLTAPSPAEPRSPCTATHPPHSLERSAPSATGQEMQQRSGNGGCQEEI